MLKEKTASKAAIIGVAAAMATSMALAPIAFAEGDIENVETSNVVSDIDNSNTENIDNENADFTDLGIEVDSTEEINAFLDTLPQNQPVYFIEKGKVKFHLYRQCEHIAERDDIDSKTLGEALAISSKFATPPLCQDCKDRYESGELPTQPTEQPSTNENTEPVPTTENNSTEPTNENPSPDVAAQDDDSRIVWHTHDNQSNIYHYNPACSGMEDPLSMTLGYAKENGYRACKKCANGDAEEPVVKPASADTSKDSAPQISKTADGQAAALIAAAIAAGIGIAGARRLNRR